MRWFVTLAKNQLTIFKAMRKIILELKTHISDQKLETLKISDPAEGKQDHQKGHEIHG